MGFIVKKKQSGEESGPFTVETLKAMATDGSLIPVDLIKKEGKTTWHRADTVNGLDFASPSLETTPLDLTQETSDSKETAFCTSCGHKNPATAAACTECGTMLNAVRSNATAPPPVDNVQAVVGADAKTGLASLNHFAWYIGMFIPFASILLPIILLNTNKQYPFVVSNAKESLNAQISMFAYTFASGCLTVVLIGYIPLIAILIYCLVLPAIAGFKTNNGETYKYPLIFRLIK
jgi:uncharacterized Tic20 family protein